MDLQKLKTKLPIYDWPGDLPVLTQTSALKFPFSAAFLVSFSNQFQQEAEP